MDLGFDFAKFPHPGLSVSMSHKHAHGGRGPAMSSNENIFFLIPEPEPVIVKPPRYVSVHKPDVNPAQFEMGVNQKRGTGSFGPKVTNIRTGERVTDEKHTTANFRRKGTGKPVLGAQKPVSLPKEKRLPGVPLRHEAPVMGLVTSKNFITSNAVENILAPARNKREEEMLETQKDYYGKVPRYLKEQKRAMENEREQIAQMRQAMRDEEAAAAGYQMSEEERAELIEGLKANWAKVNSEHSRLSFTLDIQSQVARKESLEAKMAQIEKDIEVLSRKNVIVAPN